MNDGVLALWAILGLMAFVRAWGDPTRRRLLLTAAAPLAGAGAVAVGLWNFSHEMHEWPEAALAIGGVAALTIMSICATRKGAADER